jgi:hypothetical protein
MRRPEPETVGPDSVEPTEAIVLRGAARVLGISNFIAGNSHHRKSRPSVGC